MRHYCSEFTLFHIQCDSGILELAEDSVESDVVLWLVSSPDEDVIHMTGDSLQPVDNH